MASRPTTNPKGHEMNQNLIPEPHHSQIARFIREADASIRNGGEIPAALILSNSKTGTKQVLILDMRTAPEKEASFGIARAISRRLGADTVFFMSETWTLTPEDRPRTNEILNRYGSLSAYPNRQDTASFMVGTLTGWYLAQCPIFTCKSKIARRKLGLAKWCPADMVDGYLAKILQN